METVVNFLCEAQGCSNICLEPGPCTQHRKKRDRLHKCSICDKSFRLKTDRDRHRNTHMSNAFKFTCKFPGCNFRGTPRRDYLLKHMRLSHQKTKDPVSTKHLRHYYQESTKEEKMSDLEEASIKFLEAVSEGDEPLVREMISTGVDIYSKDSKGTTAGDIASTKGYIGILQLLIAAGVNVNMNTSRPWLHQALRNGHSRTAEYLLQAGADPDAWPIILNRSSTISEEMSLHENKDAITLLTQYGGKHSQEQRLQSLLVHAIHNGDKPMVVRLFELGAVVGQPGNDGTMSGCMVLPLHAAAQKGTAQLVELLLDHGADIEVESGSGETAFSFAIERGHLEIAKLLLQRGSELQVMEQENVTLFQAAEYPVNSANRPMANLLLESRRYFPFLEFHDVKIILPRLANAASGGLLYSNYYGIQVTMKYAVTRSLVKLGGYDEAVEYGWRI